MEGWGVAIKKAARHKAGKHVAMLQCPGQMRHAKHFHNFEQLHQQCTCCENQWEAGWPKTEPEVS